MPRFYFHVHDGKEIRDEEGLELSDLEAARNEAIKASGEMIREHGMDFWSGERWQMYVVDAAGKTVIRLNFSAETRSSEPTITDETPERKEPA